MTPALVAKAWNSVTDEWHVRKNKAHETRLWEVVHFWGGNLISEDTMRVVSRHVSQDLAERKARLLEDEARGAAVLRAFQ